MKKFLATTFTTMQVLVLSVALLPACTKQTTQPATSLDQEQEVPMSAQPADTEEFANVSTDSTLEEMLEQSLDMPNEQIIEKIEIDETAQTATQDAQVKENP